MALDDENPDEVFDNEPEVESNGDETPNRSFRYMMIGLFAIGALGVLLIGLIFVSKQSNTNQRNAEQAMIQQTNVAVIALSQITPTPLPTDTPAPTNTAVSANTPLPTATPGKKNLVDTALAAGNFKTLAALLETAGLADVLKGQDPYTIFAPTDDAFAQISPESLDALKKDPQKLAALLKYHVVKGALKPSDMAALTTTNTLDGMPISVTVNGDSITVNKVKVDPTGSESTNGMIYPIDSVLVPPDMKKDVVLLPAPPATTVASGGPTAVPGSQNLVDTASAAGEFKTLSALLDAAGLTQVLKGNGPYTIFAPTDSAFAQISPESLAALKKDPKKLEELLKYHVVQGSLKPSDLATLTNLKTLSGVPISVANNNGLTTVSGVTVGGSGSESTNGVIYPIDSVLVPPDMKKDVVLLPAPQATTVASGAATPQPGKGTAVAQANVTPNPAAGSKATVVPAGAVVPTRVPPGTAAASSGVTNTKPISGTTSQGNQGLPTTGAGEDLFLLFLAAICLMLVIFSARRLRTMPR